MDRRWLAQKIVDALIKCSLLPREGITDTTNNEPLLPTKIQFISPFCSTADEVSSLEEFLSLQTFVVVNTQSSFCGCF